MVVKINGKEYKNIPENFESLDFERFCKIINILQNYKGQELDLKIFCALVGCSEKEVKESTEISDYLNLLLQVGKWNFQKIDYDKIELPESVEFLNSTLKIPKDLGKMELGLFEDCRHELTNKDLQDVTILQNVCLNITALYFYRLQNAEYDYESAMNLREKIKLLNWKIVIGFGIFFLKKTSEYLSGTMNELQQSSLLLRKSKRGLRAWLKI